ncbi:uncharacterized protein K452DRAFT_224133 [Aplosporella prunicola CBS 121167]|uniref:CUE domain-containing protein n=1 Tax=Aplosporella prunicola CBS 121167 TaxID=1176127 RepID=A0A6A6BJY9_9PEZI|nr:uncharacterized protein K452DRAFT_224133 [Aplosporella prunicola CBS 121167]KAF2143614.1 hypothetical protein K452DRAFT_224133 [Aplosporella prunicola CBS 121167]
MGVESPTTARELDFDDDQTDAAGASLKSPPPKKVSFQEDEGPTPPPKPPRPMSPQAQAEVTLIEAFPDIDPKVVKAVLVASNGKVEPAFNALLSMSDPNFRAEETPPPQPPRPTAAQSQLESDEQYARQLAAHYNNAGIPRAPGDPSRQRQPRDPRDPRGDEDDKEYSFFDDDLPVIRENVRKGFLETQTKVNKWITDFKKKLDGEEEDEDYRPGSSTQRQNFGPSQSDQLYGIRKSAESNRRSADRERYDADPRVLSDDFSALELRDNEGKPPPPQPRRPQANPDLFKPTAEPPQSGPVDEVDALYRQQPPNRQPSPGANKTKKWQPLTSIAPNPEADDHDPFSLGDSDDEQDPKTKDVKAEDTERLKRAASVSSESNKDKDGNKEGASNTVRPAERSGSVGQKDKDAEELLSGKKETSS